MGGAFFEKNAAAMEQRLKECALDIHKQIDFTENSCKDFIDVLASSAPIPGGGGASALVGAIGVALGNMVGSLTVGKKHYADVEEILSVVKK